MVSSYKRSRLLGWSISCNKKSFLTRTTECPSAQQFRGKANTTFAHNLIKLLSILLLHYDNKLVCWTINNIFTVFYKTGAPPKWSFMVLLSVRYNAVLTHKDQVRVKLFVILKCASLLVQKYKLCR